MTGAERDTAPLPAEADVVIVGAGPAGLAAAAELRRLGVPAVLVLDRERTAGGIPRHCAHSPFGLREFRRILRGPAYAARLVRTARAAGARIATGVDVVALHPGPALTVTSDAGVARIAARAVILATGVRESSRAQRLIGGTKPAGVIATGALQAMVHLERLRPFRRPVILGTELVSFSAILTCRQAGIRPVAMVEPATRPVARWPAPLFPRMLGIPLLTGTDVVAVEGRERVTGVVVSGPAGHAHIACDGLLVTGRFRPEATLLAASHLATDPRTGGPEVDSQGRLSDPAFFAAGNLLRPVETAGWSWSEGRAVARAVAAALAGRLPAPEARRIVLRGEALAWALPQRPGRDGALDRLQLRVRRPVSGRLRLLVDGAEVAGRALSARPERRITLPLPPDGARVEIVLEEDGA